MTRTCVQSAIVSKGPPKDLNCHNHRKVSLKGVKEVATLVKTVKVGLKHVNEVANSREGRLKIIYV